MTKEDVQSTLIQRAVAPTVESEPATPAEPAFLLMIAGDELGRKFPLAPGETTIGRSGANKICIDHTSASRQHAVVISDASGLHIRDNQSTNGTLVNDHWIEEVELKPGDLIRIGTTVFKFLAAGTVESAYHDELYRLSSVDGLTGLYNKRYFHEAIERETVAARRYGRPLTLLTFDIDHFKQCNDTYGHPAGDQVLQQLAGVVHHRARAADVLARTGGEEFSMILPGTVLENAGTLAEAIRQAVANTAFRFEATTLSITISMGVAQWQPEMLEANDLVKLADLRLYAAKHGGRNRVVLAD